MRQLTWACRGWKADQNRGGKGAAAGLGLVEDRHDFETESTTRKMQVGKKGKKLKGRNYEKVPSGITLVTWKRGLRLPKKKLPGI